MTKTTCILNGALVPHFRSSLVEHMMAEPFSLAIDGSNDSGVQKNESFYCTNLQCKQEWSYNSAVGHVSDHFFNS